MCLCNVMHTQHGVCLDKQVKAMVVCESFNGICLYDKAFVFMYLLILLIVALNVFGLSLVSRHCIAHCWLAGLKNVCTIYYNVSIDSSIPVLYDAIQSFSVFLYTMITLTIK